MLRPAALSFTGLSIGDEDMEAISNAQIHRVIPTEWTRVSFPVPTAYTAYEKVCECLKSTCNGRYSVFKFHDPRNYAEYKVIVRFEHPSDAVLFKLSDGHRAWEVAKEV